ncbi:uncharacterized protein LODBEIA_P20340 [Lodderomyces beijingensis]|uniref:Uncharacterized protein n=1 Tax=Lodderomyces beijingensis TaxID=1775926 RepID=A0ABP0ZI38_9ASCO
MAKSSRPTNSQGSTQACEKSLKERANRKNQVFKPLLDNPFTQSNLWPFVEPTIATDILDLIEAFIGPLFRDDKDSKSKTEVDGVTFGFNSTVKILERQAANNRGKHKDSVRQLKYVFVCKQEISPPFLISMLPVLCYTASKSKDDMVKLVQVPRGSMKKFSDMTRRANTGILGFSADLTIAERLFEIIDRSIGDIEAPWLAQIFDDASGFFPPKVTQVATVRGSRKKRKRGGDDKEAKSPRPKKQEKGERQEKQEKQGKLEKLEKVGVNSGDSMELEMELKEPDKSNPVAESRT